MNFVVYQVVQFEHVNVPNGNFLIKRLSSAAVVQTGFAVARQTGLFEQIVDFGLFRAVKYRRNRLESERCARPAEVRFQNLPDVHTRRYAQGIQKNLDRGSICEEGHVFTTHNLGNNAFVSVTTSHLVANRQDAFVGDENLDRLQNAVAKLVAPFVRIAFAFQRFKEFFDLRILAAVHADVLFALLFRQRLPNVCTFRIERVGVFSNGFVFEVFDKGFSSQGVNRLTEKLFHRLNHGRKLGGNLFVVFRFQLSQNCIEFDFFFRAERALAGDALRVNDNAFNAALNFQRVVFDVFANAAENSVEQFFFRCEFRFGLGRNFTDENVALADVRSDADNAVFVQVAKSFFRNVGNVARELFTTQFGVADFFFQFNNMDAGVRIVLNEFFGQNDSNLPRP